MSIDFYSKCDACDGDGTIAFGETNEFESPCEWCGGVGFLPTGLNKAQVDMFREGYDQTRKLEAALATALDRNRELEENNTDLFRQMEAEAERAEDAAASINRFHSGASAEPDLQ